MIALPLRLLAAFSMAMYLPGCAWLLGHAEPPQPRSPARPLPATVRVEAGPLAMEATWLGVGERIVTTRNAFGRAARVVNAYGEDSFVISVIIRPTGANVVALLPERATLGDEGDKPVRARTLTDYRSRWPGWAVASEAEEADRIAAYNHILDTLLIERTLPMGTVVTGRLAFPTFAARRKLTLTLPYRDGIRIGAIAVTWEGL